MKKIIIFLSMFILLSISIMATPIGDFKFFSYEQYQNDDQNRGQLVEQYGYWNNLSSQKVAQISSGSNYQPIIADVDNDGEMEIIIGNGNFVEVYHLEGQVLDLQDSHNTGGSRQGQYQVVFDSVYDDGLNEIIVTHNDEISVFQYDSSLPNNNLYLIASIDINATPTSSVFCDSDNRLGSGYLVCWITDDEGNVVKVQYEEGAELWAWSDDYESDGELNNVQVFAGMVGVNTISNEILVRNVTHETVNGMSLTLQGQWGAPDVADYVYDITICPTTATTLTSGQPVGYDCSGNVTVVVNDINISVLIGETTYNQKVLFVFDEPYEITSDKLLIGIVNVTNNGTSGDYYYVRTDTAPTANLYKFSYGSTHVVMGDVPSVELLSANLLMSKYNWDVSNKFASSIGTNFRPPFADYDNDGNYEIAYICDDDSICMYDATANTKDLSFDGDGETLLNSDATDVFGVMFAEIKGSDFHTVATYNLDGITTDRIRISAIATDGSVEYSQNVWEVGSGSIINNLYATPPFEIDYEGFPVVCAFGAYISGASGDRTQGGCWDLSERYLAFFGDVEAFYYDSGAGVGNGRQIFGTNHGTNILSVENMFGDITSNTFSIVTPKGLAILNTEDNESIRFLNITPTPNSEDYHIAIADITGDNNLDICGSQSGITFCTFTTSVNEPPEVDNTLEYGGFGSIPSISAPICVNTSIVFSAKQKDSHANYNYDNDILFDNERIVTNCGFNDDEELELQNGTFHNDNPTFSCYYNVTGTYQVTLFLQDDSNKDDFTEYNTQSAVVNVIDGIDGVTCNTVAQTEVGQTGTTSTTTRQAQDVEAGLNILTSGEPRLKFVIAIAMIIAITVGVGALSSSPMVAMLGAFLGGLLTLGLGLIDAWIFIIVLVIVIGLGLLWKQIAGHTVSQ